MPKTIQKQLSNEQAWYKRRCPTRYNRIVDTVKALRHMFEDFPEAACIDSSLVLLDHIPNLTIMNGWYKKGKTKVRHTWVYDLVYRCHIDVTFGQFNPDIDLKFLVVRAKHTNVLTGMGYSLFTLPQWSELGQVNTDIRKRKSIFASKDTLDQMYKKARK